MAQRYGGKYSPGADSGTGPEITAPRPFEGRVPTRLGLRVNLLFLLPFFFLPRAFFSASLGMAANLAAFALLILSGWLTREGLRAEAAYDARTVANRPAIPRKIFGSLSLGLGLALAGTWQGGLLSGVILGIVGAVLHLGAFGPDPLKAKGMTDPLGSSRVAKAVDLAEAELSAMTRAVERLGDRALETRVDAFAATARAMFRSVEQDPRDLSSARRYLGVYLEGARAATEKYADYSARRRDPKARADYVALLDDLERNFAAKTDTLMADDKDRLDIEIDVLRERLARELTPTPAGGRE